LILWVIVSVRSSPSCGGHTVPNLKNGTSFNLNTLNNGNDNTWVTSEVHGWDLSIVVSTLNFCHDLSPANSHCNIKDCMACIYNIRTPSDAICVGSLTNAQITLTADGKGFIGNFPAESYNTITTVMCGTQLYYSYEYMSSTDTQQIFSIYTPDLC